VNKLSAVLLCMAGCTPQEFTTPVYPISKEITVTVELDTPERTATANNMGVTPGETWSLGRHYPGAKPPLIRAIIAESPMDARAFCILGHEIYHELFGEFHTADLVDACE